MEDARRRISLNGPVNFETRLQQGLFVAYPGLETVPLPTPSLFGAFFSPAKHPGVRFSYTSPVLSYNLSACESERDVCPDYGDSLHCPCATGSNFQICKTLECSDPDRDPGGICGEFVFATVRARIESAYRQID